MKVRVVVTPRKDILDPQGKAVQGSLVRLGYSSVDNVRVGRVIEFDLEETSKEEANSKIEEMCERLLANPVIEDAKYEYVD